MLTFKSMHLPSLYYVLNWRRKLAFNEKRNLLYIHDLAEFNEEWLIYTKVAQKIRWPEKQHMGLQVLLCLLARAAPSKGHGSFFNCLGRPLISGMEFDESRFQQIISAKSWNAFFIAMRSAVKHLNIIKASYTTADLCHLVFHRAVEWQDKKSFLWDAKDAFSLIASDQFYNGRYQVA
ncbi:hypothetical protein [Spartinivicinus poritis]|uniref:Uncharacterized protein n=1 Tax=Spartinivicinus poritis TaxID=2994640 RepID=A0ABT5U2Z1_9GAMM|nr:hypothetical protein [Spartinivicinus sp. A2-2]MDE1460336.1 hypothetical protein [Spartinivicinus sp. A2-2]